MPMNYKGLFHYLIDEDIKESDLKKRANISAPTLSKLKKGETVTTEIIGRICNALGCEPNNIMEYDREFHGGQIYEDAIDNCDYVVIAKIINPDKKQFGVFSLYPFSSYTPYPYVLLKAKDTNLPSDFIVKCDHLYKTIIYPSQKYYSTLSDDYLKQMIDCINKQKDLSKELDGVINENSKKDTQHNDND